MFSMIQTLVPVLSFHANHEYIKTHLCRSLTQPEYKDCDGFCFLKKQIHDHEHSDMDHNSSTSYVPKVPFSYLVEIHSKESTSPDLIDKKRYRQLNESLPEQLYLDVLSPPPKG